MHAGTVGLKETLYFNETRIKACLCADGSDQANREKLMMQERRG